MKFNLSPTEREILEFLWQDGKWHTSVEFWEYFNNIGKSQKRQAIHSYLTRMEEKGLLIKNGKKFIYAYTKAEFDQEKTKEVIDTLYDGSVKRLITALAGNKSISHEEAEEMKKFIDSLEG